MIIGILVFEFPPFKHFGEAEKYECGKRVGGFAAVEADSKAATTAIVVGRGHVVVIIPFHSVKTWI